MAALLLSCEHGGNEVPEDYQFLFPDVHDVLNSHRGWDPGAKEVADFLSLRTGAPLFTSTTTRLLVELNRSINHPELLSEFSQKLSESEREILLNQYYHIYREQVEQQLSSASKPVVHLSIHSFTPEWKGIRRQVDIGLLFDPSRKLESVVCDFMKVELLKRLPDYVVRFNEPYLGIDDGLTTYLRTRFIDDEYAGVEIEINQRFVGNDHLDVIKESLAEVALALPNFLIP